MTLTPIATKMQGTHREGEKRFIGKATLAGTRHSSINSRNGTSIQMVEEKILTSWMMLEEATTWFP